MSRSNRIQTQLKATFNPELIELYDESHMHAGPNQETHFKLVLVSDAFAGMTRVRRHQAVYAQLQAELDAGLHAIALHLYTPEQWSAVKDAPDSPNCRGGA